MTRTVDEAGADGKNHPLARTELVPAAELTALRRRRVEQDARMATDDMPISMTWAQWKMIDATMDNTGSIAAVDGDTEVADRSSAIRAAGWEATGHIDRPFMDRGEWPPPAAVHSEPVSVALKTQDWNFVLHELRRWSEVGREPSNDDRAIALLITEALQPT